MQIWFDDNLCFFFIFVMSHDFKSYTMRDMT
jgi:hypothetical protein